MISARKILLVGTPASGKGKQAKFLAQYFKEQGLAVNQLSSGDELRANREKNPDSELGRAQQHSHDTGDLVPDHLVYGFIDNILKRPEYADGVILDGYPRTIPQAQYVDQQDFGLDVIIYFNPHKSREELIDRLSSRWNCPKGHLYNNLSDPPKVEGICDIDGEELFQRKDDKRETAERRMKVYERDTAPMVEYCREHHADIFKEVDASGKPEEVFKLLLKALE